MRGLLSDKEWACLEPFVVQSGALSGLKPRNHRLVLDGIFWIARGGFAMIPTKRNRKVQIPVDPAIYALRHVFERCFNKIKNARRLAPDTTREP
jgi:transposase